MRFSMKRGVLTVAALLCLVAPCQAQPTADEVMKTIGLSADDACPKRAARRP
jgi:hypothetical protein